jgi:methionyl-tRNA formyltransferase
LRVEFLTTDDPIYILPFFDEFFRYCRDQVDIVQVSLCRVMGKRSRRKLAAELIALYGPLGFTRIASQAVASRILGLIPKKPDAGTYHSLGQLCRAYRVPYEHIENTNAPEFVQGLKARALDVLVSVACPYVLKEELLSVPARSCINIHHAPLPRYRGMMPTFWQLYHGEKKVGLTIHSMTEQLDGGEILYTTMLDVRPGESLHELICRGKRHGAHCMAEVLSALNTGQLRPMKPDESASSYFTFPTAAEIQQFRQRGLRAI